MASTPHSAPGSAIAARGGTTQAGARLVVVTGFTGVRDAQDGQTWTLTERLVSGVAALAERWPGPLDLAIRARGPTDPPALDHDPVAVRAGDLPFGLRIYGERSGTEHSDDWAAIAHGAALLLLPHSRDGLVLARTAAATARVVFASENPLANRLEQIAAQRSGPLVRARRQLKEIVAERSRRAAVRAAAGIQCNGTPAFDAYAPLSPSPLLFFDGRIDARTRIAPEQLERRLAPLVGPHARPALRLAYSGRLIEIKGVAELPRVLDALRRSGIDARLDVCGSGPQDAALRSEAERLGLGGRLRLRGALHRTRELFPFVRDQVDLFVCCHRQGDPAQTYLDTLGCGVPIVGYENSALGGLARESGACLTSRRDPDALADLIAGLAREPGRLAALARKALAFARVHSFEPTMDRRVAHLRACAGIADEGPG